MPDKENESIGSIVMHGTEYPVFLIDDDGDMIDSQLGRHYACIDFKKCHIKISGSSSHQRKKSSLLHEIIHLSLFGSKFHDESDAAELESTITRLEQSLSSLGVAEFLWNLHIGGSDNAEADEETDEKEGEGS